MLCPAYRISHKYRMSRTAYPTWPPQYGITMVDALSGDGNYMIPRSQTLVFPFNLGGNAALQITAGQTAYYGNQGNTIQGWPSAEINGISIIMGLNPALARKNLSPSGYDWLLISENVDRSGLVPIADLSEPDVVRQIAADRTYYMCFKNLENKDNGLYVRFAYLQAR
jgi:hypothetical protein